MKFLLKNVVIEDTNVTLNKIRYYERQKSVINLFETTKLKIDLLVFFF